MNWDLLGQIAIALLPSVGMGFIVYYLFKSIIGADAKERKVRAQFEAEERAKLAIKKGETK